MFSLLRPFKILPRARREPRTPCLEGLGAWPAVAPMQASAYALDKGFKSTGAVLTVEKDPLVFERPRACASNTGRGGDLSALLPRQSTDWRTSASKSKGSLIS